jgi:SAM-dependent methyltransferase
MVCDRNRIRETAGDCAWPLSVAILLATLFWSYPRRSFIAAGASYSGSSAAQSQFVAVIVKMDGRKVWGATRVTFQDHFSRQAQGYTQFRPRYPRELFRFLDSVVAGHQRAWDCGCGNGQAAASLAETFDDVIATDPSASQIAEAKAVARVTYLVATAEDCPLEPRSVDLITVAQALHWFDLPRFYAQVRRVGRSASVLAAWCYGLASISPAVDRVIERLYEDILGRYWPPERKLIEDRYAGLPFPFDELIAPPLAIVVHWNLQELLGYLETWSSVQRYIERHGDNPLDLVKPDLIAAWGPTATHAVRWPLHMRVGRIG